MKRRTLLAAPALLLAGSGCNRPKTPKGQPPLTDLTPKNFDTLREAFNRDAAKTRLIALLSPT